MFLGIGTKAALDTNIVYHNIYTTKYNSASCFRQLMCSCFLLSSPNPLNYLVSLFVSSYRSSSNLSALCFHSDLYIILKYIIMLSFWFVHHPGWSAQTMLIAFLLACVTTHFLFKEQPSGTVVLLLINWQKGSSMFSFASKTRPSFSWVNMFQIWNVLQYISFLLNVNSCTSSSISHLLLLSVPSCIRIDP